MLRWHGQIGGRLAPPHLDGEFERAAVRRLAAACQPPAQTIVSPGIGQADGDLGVVVKVPPNAAKP